MTSNEIKMNDIFQRMRDGLVRQYASEFNSVGADAEEAVSTAFESAVGYLLREDCEFDVDRLRGLIRCKMTMLFRDALAASKREHGRRSVKTIAILDEEPGDGDDYRISMIDKMSLDCHLHPVARPGDENLVLMQSMAIDMVLKDDGASDRDRDIVDRLLFTSADRRSLALEKNTTVSNINRIYCVQTKRLRDLAPQVRERYLSLVRHHEE